MVGKSRRLALGFLLVIAVSVPGNSQIEESLLDHLDRHHPDIQHTDVITRDLIDTIFRMPYTLENVEVRKLASAYLSSTQQFEELALLIADIAEILTSNDHPTEAQRILFEAKNIIPAGYVGEHAMLDSELGISFDLTNDLAKCVHYFQQSLEKFASVDSLEFEQAWPLGNLIFLYEEQALYDLALELNSQAILLDQRMPSPRKHYNLAYDYGSRASLLTSLERFDSVGYYFDLATEAAELSGVLSTEIFVRTIAIESYLQQGDVDHAGKYVASDPIGALAAVNRPDVRDHNLIKTAQYYIATGEVRKASSLIEIIEVPLSISAKVDYYGTLQELFFGLGDLDKTKNATDSLKKYRSQSDREHKENNLALASLEFEREQLKKEGEIAQVKRKRQNFAMGGMAAVVALLAWLLWVLYRSNRERAQINKTLSITHHALMGKNQELERYIRSNIQLERFAHIAAHDLKAPLRTIASFTGLLKRKISGRLNDKEHTYLAFIERSTSSMGALIDDLLMYSKANSQSLDISRVHLDAIVREAIRQLQYQIAEKGATVDVRNCDITFSADALKLRQVLQNLISNALKFHSDTEPPEVTISAQENEKYIQVSVSDNGIGIPAEFHKEIFETFKTLHSKDEFEGTGMGLAICKEIIEKHGGRLWVESIPDLGSSFYFTIDDQAVSEAEEDGKGEQLSIDLN